MLPPNTQAASKGLPNIVFVSDVPVSDGASGSQALLRLFEGFPRDRVTIFQTSGTLPSPSKRLEGATYRTWRFPLDRLLRTRFTVPVNTAKFLYQKTFAQRFLSVAQEHQPGAVVTLAHGNGWILAQALATELDIPLHLIVHDGPQHFQLEYPFIGPAVRNEFIATCQGAASRWSISHALEAEIERISGIRGNVLPPLRRIGDEPVQPFRTEAPRNDCAYFGALTSPSVAQMLNDLQEELQRYGGRVHAFGGVSPSVIASAAWTERKFIHAGRFEDRSAFLDNLHKRFRFMYLPFSFDDRQMSFSLPSKVVDYTLARLPILVHAPKRSPIGQWCEQHSRAAMLISTRQHDDLACAVQKLMASRNLRRRLADGAVAAGMVDFSFPCNFCRFQEAIVSSAANNSPTEKK